MNALDGQLYLNHLQTTEDIFVAPRFHQLGWNFVDNWFFLVYNIVTLPFLETEQNWL